MMSEEAFLHKAYSQPLQWEYHQGKLITIQEESRAHKKIRLNLESVFATQIADYPSLLFMPLSDAYTYPDLMLLPEEVILYEEENQAAAVMNPTLIVEVISPQTKTLDTQTKWLYYQNIAHLQHYVLVDEQRPLLQVFSRHDQGWKLEISKDLASEQTTLIGNHAVQLREVYAGVF